VEQGVPNVPGSTETETREAGPVALPAVTDFEPLVIALVEPSRETDVQAGRTYTGVIRIPPWPAEESHLPEKQTEWFLKATNGTLLPHEKSPGVVEQGVFEGTASLRIPYVEGSAGGEIYFRISPVAEGRTSIELFSLEGSTGVFDTQNRPLWRWTGFEFFAYPNSDSQ
jgi:hypothetical protein